MARTSKTGLSIHNQMFRMEGDWTLEVNNEGTDFHYNNQVALMHT